MERTFLTRMIITLVITMSSVNVSMAKEPGTSVCCIEGTEYFVWNIDCRGTLHVIPLEATTSNFDKSPFYKYRKQIKNVVIEDDFYCDKSFTTIGNGFLKGLDKVESIKFSKSIRNIGESAFEGCTALKEIEIPATVENIGRNALRGCSNLECVSLPFVGYDGSVWVNETDKNDLSWIFGKSKGKSFYTVDQTMCDNAVSFTLPVSLKSFAIGSGIVCYDVFTNCTSLEDISLGMATMSMPTALATGQYSHMSLFTKL